LEGPEISVLAFSDGYTIIPLPAAQDHKRIGEGDTGLNTGGMGAYAPAPVATPQVMERIMNESLRPTIDGMRREGTSLHWSLFTGLSDLCQGYPFVGMLFTGFMLTPAGPKVLEYNVRFGDPETEALMLLLKPEVDLAAILLVSFYLPFIQEHPNLPWIQACAEHRLDSIKIDVRDGYAVSVILASAGYPGSYPKGIPIEIPSAEKGDFFQSFYWYAEAYTILRRRSVPCWHH